VARIAASFIVEALKRSFFGSPDGRNNRHVFPNETRLTRAVSNLALRIGLYLALRRDAASMASSAPTIYVLSAPAI